MSGGPKKKNRILNITKRKTETEDYDEADNISKSIPCMSLAKNATENVTIKPTRTAKLRCIEIMSNVINIEATETYNQQLQYKRIRRLKLLERENTDERKRRLDDQLQRRKK